MTYAINYKRFALVFLGMTIGLPLLLVAIGMLTGIDLNNAGTSIIPIMIASLIEGQHFARADARRPTSAEAWKIALQLTGLAVILSVGLAILSFLIWPDLMGLVPLSWFGIIALVVALVMFITSRVFFALGAKTQLRAMKPPKT